MGGSGVGEFHRKSILLRKTTNTASAIPGNRRVISCQFFVCSLQPVRHTNISFTRLSTLAGGM